MNQTSFTFPAKAHRAVRMRRATEATERADADCAGWAEQAYAFLKRFARRRKDPWLSEEFIYWSKGAGLKQPKDKKAFGSIVRRALNNGVIRRAGVSTATRNSSLKPTWRAA